MDLLLIYVIILTAISALGTINKRTRIDTIPFLIGCSCGLARQVLGYFPHFAEFFVWSGLSALLITTLLTVILELFQSRKKGVRYLYFYVGVCIAGFIAELYGVHSGLWYNLEEGLMSLPWRGIFVYYFSRFFPIMRSGEVINDLWFGEQIDQTEKIHHG